MLEFNPQYWKTWKINKSFKSFLNFPFSFETMEFVYRRVHPIQSAGKEMVKQEFRIQHYLFFRDENHWKIRSAKKECSSLKRWALKSIKRIFQAVMTECRHSSESSSEKDQWCSQVQKKLQKHLATNFHFCIKKQITKAIIVNLCC